jgi:hypothetical protein
MGNIGSHVDIASGAAGQQAKRLAEWDFPSVRGAKGISTKSFPTLDGRVEDLQVYRE